ALGATRSCNSLPRIFIEASACGTSTMNSNSSKCSICPTAEANSCMRISFIKFYLFLFTQLTIFEKLTTTTMNKFWTFIAGAFSGILLTIVVLLIIGSAKGESSIPGLTTFEERGQMMEAEQYSIIQTLSDSYALAMEISLD